MRKAFVETLTQLAQKNSKIYLLTGDLGFMAFEEFRDEFKERFINMGIAESNMIGVASGLALSGKIVFVYSIVPFVTYRCLEHIRNDICYNNLNVNIVGVGGGYSYGIMGATHHALEDIGVMSALPNMTVICPGDPIEVEAATKAAVNFKGPIYIRLGRTGERKLHSLPIKFEIGKGIVMKQGNNLTLISTGNMLELAITVADQLVLKGINARVVSMPTVKPLDIDIVLRCAKETKNIFTLEEHSPNGGLRNAVATSLIENGIKNCYFKAFTVPEGFAKRLGSQEYLRKQAFLSAADINNFIISILDNTKEEI